VIKRSFQISRYSTLDHILAGSDIGRRSQRGRGLRLVKAALVSILAVLMVFAFSLQNVGAQTVSVVYFNPSQVGSNQVQNTGGSQVFTVSVRLDLATGEAINEFDVTLNYTNYPGVTGSRINAGNVFTGTSYSSNTVGQCIDGNSTSSSITCMTGQVRFTQVLLGGSVSSGDYLLFNVTFKVVTPGTSVFTLDAALVNPEQAGVIDPHLIPFVAKGGAFSNTGLVSFFNFWASTGPSILLSQPAFFDASPSFNANGTSIANYTWDFHDGSPVVTLPPSLPQTSHVFNSAGTYSVQLTVEDTKGGRDSITRMVVVVRALGNLQLSLKPLKGGVVGTVTVQVFNASSASPLPFAERTADASGGFSFGQLSPGTYLLKFSGPNIDDYSKSETVIAGWTMMDTVYLNVKIAPPDYSGIVYLASTLAAVGVTFGLILWKKRTSSGKDRVRKVSPKATRYRMAGSSRMLSSCWFLSL
jgi:PKD domain-containing protein